VCPLAPGADTPAMGRGPPPCGPVAVTGHRFLSGSTYGIFSRIDEIICAAL